MIRNLLPAWLCIAFVVLPASSAGQEIRRSPRFVVGLSLAAATPSGDVGDVVGTGLSIGAVTGYHLHRLLRVDVAGESVLSGSATTYTIQTTGGERSVNLGAETFLRAGPSLVLPAPKHLVLTVGGGILWGRYVEEASGNEIIIGFEPESRSGTGSYGTVSLERMVSSVGGTARGLGVGLTVSVYNLDTDGPTLHGLFQGSARDRWTTVGVAAVGHF